MFTCYPIRYDNNNITYEFIRKNKIFSLVQNHFCQNLNDDYKIITILYHLSIKIDIKSFILILTVVWMTKRAHEKQSSFNFFFVLIYKLNYLRATSLKWCFRFVGWRLLIIMLGAASHQIGALLVTCFCEKQLKGVRYLKRQHHFKLRFEFI